MSGVVYYGLIESDRIQDATKKEYIFEGYFKVKECNITDQS